MHFNITTLAPIKYLSSDRSVTWSVHRLCSSSRSFTPRSQICVPTNIPRVAIEDRPISQTISPDFTATGPMSVGSQIGNWEAIWQLEMHNLHTDHVTIRQELKYSIGGTGVGTLKFEPGYGSNPAEMPLF